MSASSADHTGPVMRAVMSALRASAASSSIVGDRVFDYVPDPDVSPMPYIRIGLPIWSPYEATGVIGGTIRVTVHGFLRRYSYDEAVSLQAAIHSALADRELALSSGYLLEFNPVGSVILDEQEDQGTYHVLSQFDAVTGEEPT